MKIGTDKMDEFFLMNHLMGDVYEDEVEEEFEMPKLRASKICYFDLKPEGKLHPMADDILRWQFEMEQAGRYDEIPDDPKEIIKLFEEGQLP